MRLALPGNPASKLAVRIYLVALAQFVLVIGGSIGLVAIEGRAPFPFRGTLTFISDAISDTRGDPAALDRMMSRLRSSVGTSMAVYDETGELVARDPSANAPRTFSELRNLPAEVVSPVHLSQGRTWRLVLVGPPPRPPRHLLLRWIGFVLLSVGATSWLMARSLARPLRRLAEAANDLGSGRLNTRLHLRRSDEIGQVAAAFDQMADRVTHALRVEKELLANVSHELRTPLQRIHIAVELGAEGDAATTRESLAEIAEDLAELERIVEDVLVATRLSLSEGSASATASPPLRREMIGVAGLLNRSLERFRSVHPNRSLRVSIADDLPPLTVDGVLIRRVVDNLLDNADKYTDDPASELFVSAGLEADRIYIEVRDCGVGIAPEDLDRIFEPFFRADRSRARSTGGLGLGLTLARRIVEAHGGKVSLKSLQGQGTKVRVELPLGSPGVTRDERGALVI